MGAFHRLSIIIMDTRGLYPPGQNTKDLNYRLELKEIMNQMICAQIGNILNLAAEHIEIAHDRKGAPYLPEYPSLHISMSYTDRFAVYALSTGRVGIDVERMRVPNRSLARQFFCPEELREVFRTTESVMIQDLPEQADEAVCRRWTALWTLKEAYGKYQGDGLPAVRRSLTPTRDICRIRELKVREIPVAEGYACTVVSGSENAEIIRIDCRAALEQAE